MIFKLVDRNRFLQGLPVLERLDDTTLSEEAKALLATAVSIGIYAPESEPPAPSVFSKSKKGNADEPASSN